MPTLDLADLPSELDTAALEAMCRDLWERSGIHRFDPSRPGEVFSIDTPPPYVSAAHLHVGHAMSYSQAEFVIRYQRMMGRNIFYPMGFDDNGLPTERYVEKTFNINKKKTTRAAFRALCLEETRKGGKEYEQLWRALGLSVDWTLRYSTIDDHCRATAQKSFLDLERKGRVYRSDEPVLWDTHFETALAQADLESVERTGQLHDVAFLGEDGTPLVIATTRPELIPACVALYFHPEDARYQHLRGRRATVPQSGHTVPILCDEDVALDFGTGLMMVCTFGDGEDVRRWKRDGLETRIVIGPDGRMTALAGAYEGATVEEARKRILKDLKEAGQHLAQKNTPQNVSVSERSGVPVEWVMAPQWFIRVLDKKDAWLKRSEQLGWFPEWMKVRLDHWVQGLKYDWNISRQRFYGVPFPVWFCEDCGHAAFVTDERTLPVDPVEDPCPVAACEACGGGRFRGEPDVMDTWMTSSLTPLINSNWAGTEGRVGSMDLFPMSVRVQAFEIIRTWLFYTVVKGDEHFDTIPWKQVMISGWGLNEQGKKISKRDLEQFTDKEGYNRYEPYAVIQRYGADALRYWAAGSHLGNDTRYNEKDVKAGRKLVVKLWNAARFVGLQLQGWNPDRPRVPVEDRTPEDRWLLAGLHGILGSVHRGFQGFDYAVAREATDRFFWATFCDDYLEMVKDRFWNPDRYDEFARESARATLWESLRIVLGLYAPFLPFVTEGLYQRIYRPFEGTDCLHVTAFPVADARCQHEVPEMEFVTAVLRAVRARRTERRLSQGRALEAVIIDVASVPAWSELATTMSRSVQAVARAVEVRFGPAEGASDVEGLRVDIVEGAVPEREVEG